MYDDYLCAYEYIGSKWSSSMIEYDIVLLSCWKDYCMNVSTFYSFAFAVENNP